MQSLGSFAWTQVPLTEEEDEDENEKEPEEEPEAEAEAEYDQPVAAAQLDVSCT